MEQLCCLYNVPEGACAHVRKLTGRRDVCARLNALGITPGTEIVSCGAGASGCRVKVRDVCVVLDEAVAQNILCAVSGDCSLRPSPCGEEEQCLSI